MTLSRFVHFATLSAWAALGAALGAQSAVEPTAYSVTVLKPGMYPKARHPSDKD
jgi:hypothetical protein